MNAKLQARVSCNVHWCTEQPEHASPHMRVLLSHVSPSPGSTSGAVQLVAFAHSNERVRLSLVLVNRDLCARPERVAVALHWPQVDEIAFALASRQRMVWDAQRADDAREPASLEVKPSRYGSALDLTAAQDEPIRALTALLDAPLCRRLSDAMLAANHEFRAVAA